VRHRVRVFDDWGFGQKLRIGKGLSALFSGRPGTGKTLAAEVMAASLELDLYAVDLSQVVSKYIGETEKNLSRIFQEAEDSNAILFFDEADALFGKRTEVADAHDRYANVETSYLLQRMEAYGGMVILASNLRENMDDAFLRRIRFVVEFPFPDATQRRAIWQAHFPADAPVADDVDLDLLAERMQVAGGHIKNIVLSAAFFAAANGQVIAMEHVLRGARREYEKIGKLWDPRLFEPAAARRR
jgi:SpoVK/Ycf46/Vps4 family AAA+-type ATPase